MCSSHVIHPNVFFLIPDLQIAKKKNRFWNFIIFFSEKGFILIPHL